MADSTTMTLRVDTDLKGAVDAVARAQGISTTEYIERALKGSLHTTCKTCGRSSIIGAALPGFSPQFEAWVSQMKQVAVNQPILIETLEAGQQWVYWARLRDAVPMTDGVLSLKIFVDRRRSGQDYALPRGVIIGYREDAEGQWYNIQRLVGFGDGNARLFQRLVDVERAQQAGMMIPPPRGRGRG